MTDIAIRVQNLSKCYHIYDNPRDRLKQFVVPALQRMAGQTPRQYYREFWALKDISLEIKKGETVGIIGRNGSGKSTLLQIICGTLTPTGGSVETKGRVAALLELGSGFNPEFTGRENVYMNASILGLSKEEVDERFDDIAAFADIGDFIEQPVKTYSSGMVMRLAFSVAINVDANILIIDEALAVGDIAFQQKCYQKLRKLKSSGISILFVSHDLGSIVEFCSYAALLDYGKTVASGLPKDVVNKFKQILSTNPIESQDRLYILPSAAFQGAGALSRNFEREKDVNEYSDGAASIIDWGVLDKDGRPSTLIDNSEEVEILIGLRINVGCRNPIVGYFLTDAKGREIVGTNTEYEGINITSGKCSDTIFVRFKQKLAVAPGVYFLNIGCSEYIGDKIVAHHRLYNLTSLTIHTHKRFVGFCSLSSEITIVKLE